MNRRSPAALSVLLLVLVNGTAAAARPQDAPDLPAPERLTQVEVLRLLDAYAVVQAQDALGLDTAQYGVFVANYKQLLETRRRHREARVRALGDLARVTRPAAGGADEAQVRERLKALADQQAQAEAEIRKATEAVTQPLTVTQRARFLVFEDQIERRKLDLLARARAARPGARRAMPR